MVRLYHQIERISELISDMNELYETAPQEVFMNNFQRNDSKSNSEVGRIFENNVKEYFEKSQNLKLNKNLIIKIGINKIKKNHAFDLGNEDENFLSNVNHTNGLKDQMFQVLK